MAPEGPYAIKLRVTLFFIYYENDNPSHPVLQVGYNTNRQFQSQFPHASGEREARWNFAFWLQNEELVFGLEGAGKDMVRDLAREKGFRYLEDEQLLGPGEQIDLEDYEKDFAGITRAFIQMVADAARSLHTSGFLTSVFHRETPVILRDLEYACFQECLAPVPPLNPSVNGEILSRDFLLFCNGE